MNLIVPIHGSFNSEGVYAGESRETLLQDTRELWAFGVSTFPVGNNVLVHKDDVVVASNDIGSIDLGIPTPMDDPAVQNGEAKFAAMVVLGAESRDVLWADAIRSGSLATVDVAG